MTFNSLNSPIDVNEIIVEILELQYNRWVWNSLKISHQLRLRRKTLSRKSNLKGREEKFLFSAGEGSAM